MLKVTAKERLVCVLAFRSLFLFSLLALSVVNSAQAQSSTDGTTPTALTPGAPAGAYPLSDFESVNLFNGNLNFSLPMARVAGRGAARVSMFLRIEQHWRIERTTNCSPCEPYAYPTYNWWTFMNPGYGPGVMQYRTANEGDAENSNGVHFPLNSLLRATFTGSDGTEYEMRDVSTNGQPKPVDWQDIIPPPQGRTFLRGTLFATADGTSATFISCQRNGALIPIHDGDDGDGAGVRPSGYLMLRDGTRYRIDTGLVSWMRDRNGNVTRFEYEFVGIEGQLYGRVTRITDSMGRQVNIQYNQNDGGQYGLCDRLTFTGYQGLPRIVRVSKANLGSCLRSDFPQTRSYASLFPELVNASSSPYDDLKVSALWLPNDKSYKFSYDAYGELARVVLPTGGAIEYDWAPGINNLSSVNGQPPSGIVNDNVYRRVTARRVYPNGGTGATYENRTTYSVPETLNGQNVDNAGYVLAYQYSQAGSALSRTKHYFEGYASYNPYIFSLAPFGRIYYVPWKWGRETRTEILDLNNETTVLRRVEQNIEQREHVSWWTGTANEEPPNDPRITYTLTTLTDVSPNLVSKQSAVDPQTGAIGFDQYNNPTDVWEYDFGQGTAGSLLRHSVSQYLTSGYDTVPGGPSAPNAGATIHLRSLPLMQQVFDAGGTLRAQTSYEYDNYNQNGSDANHAPLTNRANIIGITSQKDISIAGGYNPATDYGRGNVTKVSRWLNTGGSVDAYLQYDIAGSVVKSIDPKGNSTLIDYSSSFQYAFPTQTTSAVPDPTGANGSSTAFTTFTNYDFSSGLQISSTDANGQSTFADYTDPLDRLKSVVRPAGGGSTTYTYVDDAGNLYLRTQTTQDASQTLIADQLFDGMGRPIETRQYEPGGGYVSTKQTYDSMGRVSQTSNPFRPASESAAWSTRTYDAFGRVTAITTPDQAVARTDYSGNRVLATDQAGKQRISKSNGLSQLTDIWEIRSADSATEAVTFLNHPEVTAGYRTSYLYNVLDDLVKVTQGSQNRYFMYDSLKRLTRARNPEQDTSGSLALTDPVTGNGQWCVLYEYDNNSNLFRKKDARTVVTTYEYDALNRVKTRSYSGETIATPTVSYKYDGAGTTPTVAYSKGRLTLVSSSVSSYSYDEYDQMGRVKRCTQTTANQPYAMSYAYDLAGNMISETYPSGRTISTSYDSAGRMSAVNGQKTGEPNKTYASQFSYWPQGAVKSMQLGNSKWEHTDYNNRLQPTLIGVGTSSTDSSLLKLEYSYSNSNLSIHDNNGNVLTQRM